MSKPQSQPDKLLPLVIGLLVLITVFHLANAFAGRSLFRAVHLGTALDYSGKPIDVLKPVIVGFNATDAPAAQELPLWQAAVGYVFKWTNSTWYGWANLVSLLFFFTGLWPLFQVGRRYLGERTAWWGLVFFLSQPLVVLFAGQASTDGFCLAISLWFLFFAERMISTGRLVWFPAALFFGVLAALSKLPFFMVASLCAVVLLVMTQIRNWRSWLMLIGIGGCALVSFMLWTRYTNALAARLEFPYFELRMSHSPFLVHWYFGDLAYRLNPANWAKGAWRFLHGTLGCLPMVFVFILGLLRPEAKLSKLWLLCAGLVTLVFTHVVLVHWHYYLMFCPAVALLCGAAAARWENVLVQEVSQRWLRLGLVLLTLTFSAIDGVIATKVSIYFDSFPAEMAVVIQKHTQPGEKVIVYGGDWGGEELFRSGRKGFYAYSLDTMPSSPTVPGLRQVLTDENALRRLRELGYTKLVLLSESPVRYAAVAVNPGSKRKRNFFPREISPAVDAWPEVFRSEDILIKTIP
jgi:hypothetical protein